MSNRPRQKGEAYDTYKASMAAEDKALTWYLQGALKHNSAIDKTYEKPETIAAKELKVAVKKAKRKYTKKKKPEEVTSE